MAAAPHNTWAADRVAVARRPGTDLTGFEPSGTTGQPLRPSSPPGPVCEFRRERGV